ncbi:hypothetical protein CRG98_031716 [Punica granatum]|uniref:tRNA/rRNA methyltransferase SpoU type domain-containing protein n=1 Tax=Punica granatum TaxID=22663 RepID=A0A2I0IVA8_PUNGR|nr:hypothetical protein CRG98_031716 [Punica granatum]
MSACKTLTRASLRSLGSTLRSHQHSVCSLSLRPFHSFTSRGLGFKPFGVSSRRSASIGGAVSLEAADFTDEESCGSSSKDAVEQLVASRDDVARLMKMERRSLTDDCDGDGPVQLKRWFPYLDRFECGGGSYLSSGEVLEAVDPLIMDARKERFRNVVKNRSYSVCLVVEGLCDFGNVSAAFRSADALGLQSVHVVSCDSKRCCDA